MLVLLGLPPFAMFASELSIARGARRGPPRLGARGGAAADRRRVRRAGAQHGPDAARRLRRPPTARSPCPRPSPRPCSSASPPRRARRHRGPADRPVRTAAASLSGQPMSRDWCGTGCPPERAADMAEELLGNRFPPGDWSRPTTTATASRRLPVPRRCARPPGRARMRCARRRSAAAVAGVLSFPASRFEREMADLYGIRPIGHPLPRRLVRHAHWPEGWYPMRHDAGARTRFDRRPVGSRSSRSTAPGSTRSRSARCTPG